MKHSISILILIYCLVFCYSCNKNKVELTQVLPLIGLYEGRILSCDNELVEIPLTDSTSTKEFYKRRVLVSSLKEYLKGRKGNEMTAIQDSLGISSGSVDGNNSHTLIIETNWLCLSESGLLCMDTSQWLERYPIAVEVQKIDNNTNPFVLKSKNIPDMSKTPCMFEMMSVQGFHINASLQIEYTMKISGETVSKTMICQKN